MSKFQPLKKEGVAKQVRETHHLNVIDYEVDTSDKLALLLGETAINTTALR
ncbi:MAG: hypothetical protein PVH19_15095 [Planctomycetia bacterium]